MYIRPRYNLGAPKNDMPEQSQGKAKGRADNEPVTPPIVVPPPVVIAPTVPAALTAGGGGGLSFTYGFSTLPPEQPELLSMMAQRQELPAPSNSNNIGGAGLFGALALLALRLF